MDIAIEAVTAVCFCIAAAAILWAVKGKLLAPRPVGKILTVADVSSGGDVEELCRWLEWIKNSGGDVEIVLLCDGMTDAERRRARLLTEKDGGCVLSADELVRMIGDRLWQERKNT